MKDLLSPIPNAINIRGGLPRADWRVIASWVDSNVEPSALDETWVQIARDWLSRLSQSLPHHYAVHESNDFLLLTAEDTLADRVLHLSERARRVILKTLDGVAIDEGYGKHVILLFSDTESYYDYITDFYPDEGDFALTGGMFFDAGYGHFALCPAYSDDYERIIAHELNHALLRHLPLPLWLNEGVAQVIEDVVMASSDFNIDHEIVRRHRAYWNSETIDTFWSGESFYSPDDGQELSYHLSQVLFRNLMSDHPDAVNKILNSAHFSDAGNAAFVDVCNVSLTDRCAQFLGDGTWDPRTDYTALDG